MAFDLSPTPARLSTGQVSLDSRAASRVASSLVYYILKSVFDLALALLSLPIIAAAAGLLMLLNPLFNPGPLFFCQTRLGQGRVPFVMWKFRTMSPATALRGAHDGLEADRITPFAFALRRLRIDELPNFLNVLSGEMSVIGPRPDAAGHAQVYLDEVPLYAHRFQVKPGITGLAQVERGYAEGIDATAVKAQFDKHYVDNAALWLDAYIVWRTLWVLLSGFGAK